MFVWSSFRSRHGTATPYDDLLAEALAGLSGHVRSAEYGLRVFQTPPIKSWEPSCGLHLKAFERARRRAMLGRLDWGIPPVAHRVWDVR